MERRTEKMMDNNDDDDNDKENNKQQSKPHCNHLLYEAELALTPEF